MNPMAAPRAPLPETTSIYQIFTRNFTKEGTLRAAQERLGGIKELGFDWVYLTPIHPVGVTNRKGSRGSPYAVADYREVDPALGTELDLIDFVEAAQGLGLKTMIDVVYNHTSPDSRLAREHPEWFIRDAAGRPTRKCEDWSDVVDFDFSSSPALWDELIASLQQWHDLGVSGFRCDVASLVPVDFWLEARRRVNKVDPESGVEGADVVWLAESVHPSFLKEMRERGFGAWSEPELHGAFDLSYDYDGWERLERVWSGRAPLSLYMDFLYSQETHYPANARKIRYLENHDQERAAWRFGRGSRLAAWTVFTHFLPGLSFAYMGQEFAIESRPSLFDKDVLPWEKGDKSFRDFFKASLAATRRAKDSAPRFSWTSLGEGLLRLERRGVISPTASGATSGSASRFVAIVNLDGRTGRMELAKPIEGRDLLTGKDIRLSGSVEIPRGAILVEVK